MFELDKMENVGAQIKVIGVGGCGCNAVNNMINAKLKGVEFLACNTDIQTLKSSMSANRVQIGTKLTKGLGAGGSPESGKNAALESEQEIRSALQNTDMVFITAGMGGGTGTGASPVVARIAKDLGILTVAVVTKPFPFEGKRKMTQAETGEKELEEHVDALIIIPNNRLLSMAGKNVPLLEAFRMADEILTNAVKGISDLINNTGLVNVDFMDVKAVMIEKGKALMGIGIGSGENRAQVAAQAAISSPLLEDMDIHGAKGLLINITSSPDITMSEIHEASSLIQSAAHDDANIIWGVVIDENMNDEVAITVVATGFANKPIVLSSGSDKGRNQQQTQQHQQNREIHNASIIDYNKPAFIRKKEEKEKEVVKLGMVVDESVLDQELYNVPTFLRKKAD
jgi:cell division protein FtsZ